MNFKKCCIAMHILMLFLNTDIYIPDMITYNNWYKSCLTYFKFKDGG